MRIKSSTSGEPSALFRLRILPKAGLTMAMETLCVREGYSVGETEAVAVVPM